MAPDARIVVLDIADNRVIAGSRLKEAAQTLAAPGSTLKPLFLYQLIASGRWAPAQRVACDRSLAIAGHRLSCSHPQLAPFNAREALAWSCNSYFAQLAMSINPGEPGELLRRAGLLGPTGLAPREATAEFREPQSRNDTSLLVLGVARVRATPLELAESYRWLARELAAHRGSAAATTVEAGLTDSSTFGTSQGAGVAGLSVAGKTGTAETSTGQQTHGWFAGLAPMPNPRVVVVVYLPAGRGADAARVAGTLLARAPLGQP